MEKTDKNFFSPAAPRGEMEGGRKEEEQEEGGEGERRKAGGRGGRGGKGKKLWT